MRVATKLATIAVAAATALTVGGCAGAGSFGSGGSDTVTIAIVSNSQMQDAISLSDQFEAENPGVKLKFVSLSENEARAKITASIATGGGEFDVVMISNYETPQWAENGWLANLSDYAAQHTRLRRRRTSSRRCGSRCPTTVRCIRCRSTASRRS